MITREQALAHLRRGIGNPAADFREGPWEAIDGVLHNRRQLVVRAVDWINGLVGDRPRLVDGGEGCAKTRNRKTREGARNRKTREGARNRKTREGAHNRRTGARDAQQEKSPENGRLQNWRESA